MVLFESLLMKDGTFLRTEDRDHDGGLNPYQPEQAIVNLRPECTLPQSPEERRRKFVNVVRAHVACRGLLPEALCRVTREAITALHKEGYYHCDLHERNLIISRDRKTIYLIDFGKSNPNGDVSGSAHNYHRFDGEGRMILAFSHQWVACFVF